MKILFCSSNEKKKTEVQQKVGADYTIVNLNDLGHTEEIPETADTFEGNALLKATFGFKKYGNACFSDDSGLEVEALNNAPGVYSARYAGEPRSDERNMDKLLLALEGIENRSACFKTVIAYINKEESVFYFEGKIEGVITKEKRGNQGFGYDPIFIPNGYDKTFAELSLEEKSKISHRALAVEKFIEHLKNEISN
jgi:XTP/dITP diphosphohydrolase